MAKRAKKASARQDVAQDAPNSAPLEAVDQPSDQPSDPLNVLPDDHFAEVSNEPPAEDGAVPWPAKNNRVFISYRRADSAPMSKRIYHYLHAKLGKKLFWDIANIPQDEPVD